MGTASARPSGIFSLLPREWLLRACTWQRLQGATLGPGGPLSAPLLGRKNPEHLRACFSWGEGRWICISELATDPLEISLRWRLCLKQSPLHNFSLCPFPDSFHCLPWEHNLDTCLHTSIRLWEEPHLRQFLAALIRAFIMSWQMISQEEIYNVLQTLYPHEAQCTPCLCKCFH